MQKLKSILLCHLKSQQGSAIVGVLALSIVMAIAGAGYMQYAANTVGHEVRALQDARYFAAAESGLLLGSTWIGQRYNNVWPTAVDIIATGLSVNGINVNVRDSLDLNGKVYVISTASKPDGTLQYNKVLTWKVDPLSAGGSGTVINNFTGLDMGLSGVTFDGPGHFNSNIILAAGVTATSANADLFMNGLVAVHSDNNNQVIPGLGAQRAGYQNDYSYGVGRYNPSSLTAATCDAIFTNQYLSGQDRVALTYTVDNSFPLLPSSKTPTLQFLSGGGVKYDYYQGNTLLSQTYTPAQVNNMVLMASTDSIKVFGIVNGRMSVVNPTGNINIVGEVKYADALSVSAKNPDGTYNTANNYGVPSNDGNVVAFFSNQNILIDGSSWVDAAGNNFPNKATDTYIAGLLYAGNSIDVNLTSANIWCLGTRSAETLGQHYWNRGNNTNLGFLYDSRFGAGLTPAGVKMSLHHVDDNNPNRLGLQSSLWTERNPAL